jgi:hypothetical protein
MSMAAMVTDMRNRFVVAAVFALAVLVWSPIGTDAWACTCRCRSGCGWMRGSCC